jgi:hypothetical protein
LSDQDELYTQHVAYYVQKVNRISGIDIEFCDDDEIMWCESGEPVNSDHWKALNEAYNNDVKILELDGEKYVLEEMDRYGYKDQWETVTVTFTMEGAENYLKANKHNLSRYGKPRIYGESFHRNFEMITIRETLAELVALIKETKND